MEKTQFLQYMATDFPQLQMSLNDLENPSADFMKRFYSAMLDQITRIPAGELYDYSGEQKDFLKTCCEGSYLLHHVSSFNLYSAIKYVFDQIDSFQTEFHFSDLLMPQLSPKRSYIFMCKMYLFTGSCADFDCRFQELQNFDEKSTLIAKLTRDSEILKKQIDENKKNKIAFAEKIIEMKKSLALLAQDNNDAENLIKELQNIEEDKTSVVRRLEEQERKAQEDFNKLDSEKKYYESLIVSDDSQIRDHHERLQAKKEECLKNLQVLETQVQERWKMVSQLDKVLNTQETLKSVGSASAADELRALYDLLCSSRKMNEAFSKQTAEIEAKLKERKVTIQELTNQLSLMKGEKDAISQEFSKKLGKLSKIKEDLNHSIISLSQRNSIEENTLEKIRKEIKELETYITHEVASIQSAHDSMTIEIENSLKILESQLLGLKEKAFHYLQKNGA